VGLGHVPLRPPLATPEGDEDLGHERRSEGGEITVGKPKVIIKEINGSKQEPYEHLVVEVPTEHHSSVIRLVLERQGDFQKMENHGHTTQLEFFIPARLPDSVLDACRSVALTAHTVMGLRDWSRTDLMVDSEGRPWFLEVNAAPGMTETSLFPQALSAAGMSLGDLASRLIRTAIGRVSDDRPIGSQA
jgi:hypothetical protein